MDDSKIAKRPHGEDEIGENSSDNEDDQSTSDVSVAQSSSDPIEEEEEEEEEGDEDDDEGEIEEIPAAPIPKRRQGKLIQPQQPQKKTIDPRRWRSSPKRSRISSLHQDNRGLAKLDSRIANL